MYRIVDQPRDGRIDASIDGARTYRGETVRTPQGEPSLELEAIRVIMAVEAPSLTVRFRVTTATWRTVESLDKSACSIGREKGRNFASSGAIAVKEGGTTLCLGHDVGAQEAIRLVAVDGEGKEHTPARESGFSGGDVRQIVSHFDLPPEAIQNFRVQTRPYDEIVMPDVATDPIPTDPR
ncbi:hypothetical protein [Planctomyces sp. SH-PL62]|uniref:hypothetical protein n=1 Tax=Planctomyces sp. SH-PL62 TaxID=1636152 RepID=UPI00078EC2B8|nr:hypothetical protein [Planctomyces sp. SH-PL62]AMV40588.1 hypothetical protein VT85_24370 [Planctomyces sp. SH-PL62]